MGATFVTVHAYPQTMNAAVAARTPAAHPAVTVLTSYDDADLDTAGYGLGVAALVGRRRAGPRAGCRWARLPAEEAASLRSVVGTIEMALVTPGIRPSAPLPATRSV